MRALAAALAMAVLPGALAGQIPGQPPLRMLPPPSGHVAVSKPLMGENYDASSGMVDVEARLPRWSTGGILVRAGAVYATAGRTRSAVLANPSVGVWGRLAGIPMEGLVSLPLRRELGDDDFATDMGVLTHPVQRERYGSPRWGLLVSAVPRLVFRDGSVGTAELGVVALQGRGPIPASVRARYGASLALGFSRSVQGGARFAGTVRLDGAGAFSTRADQDLTLFVRLPHVAAFPEISFRLPLDIDRQDFVTGIIGLRMHF